MERPGFNPQALARKPGSQRSGANKEKKQAAQRVRRRLCAGGNRGGNGGARDGHGSIRLLRNRYSTFWRFVQDGEGGVSLSSPAGRRRQTYTLTPDAGETLRGSQASHPAREEAPVQI